ncbi:hypothetical protein BJ165DRAFT_1398517 [Panaeolus papilionaceus]|nr:hypothetical protein BJ165DRAFT_1398517 [Panaeolus papilionaceus]
MAIEQTQPAKEYREAGETALQTFDMSANSSMIAELFNHSSTAIPLTLTDSCVIEVLLKYKGELDSQMSIARIKYYGPIHDTVLDVNTDEPLILLGILSSRRYRCESAMQVSRIAPGSLCLKPPIWIQVNIFSHTSQGTESDLWAVDICQCYKLSDSQ